MPNAEESAWGLKRKVPSIKVGCSQALMKASFPASVIVAVAIPVIPIAAVPMAMISSPSIGRVILENCGPLPSGWIVDWEASEGG